MKRLFSDVRIIKGANRSMICDLTRGYFDFIPNLLFDLLTRYKDDLLKFNIEKIKSNESKMIIKSYFDFLERNEYVFDLSPKLSSNFIDITLNFEYPFTFTSITISLSNNNYNNIIKIINNGFLKLSKNIAILVDISICINYLHDIIKIIKSTHTINIELYVPNKIHKLILNKITTNDILHIYKFEGDNYFNSTNYHENWPKLNLNITLFSESLKYNTYFNKKIYIDNFGNIRNSYETDHNDLNINSINSIDQLLKKTNSYNFKKYWYVHKDLIDICKDCEIRHMCIDNRLPLKRNNNSWYHEKECNYNPYINKWKHEKDYSNLKECGIISNDKGCYIDIKMLNKIQKKIWE